MRNQERSYNTLSYINNVTDVTNVNVCQCPVPGRPSVRSTPTTRTTCQWRPSNIVCCELVNDFKFYWLSLLRIFFQAKIIFAHFFLLFRLPFYVTNRVKIQQMIEKWDGMFYCQACEYTIMKRYHMKEHVERHIEGLSYQCVCSLLCLFFIYAFD